MTTLNRDLFVDDPAGFSLPNAGVASLDNPATSQQWDVLRHELRTFVCEGEYASGLDRILHSFLTRVDHATQPAVWVSGFYGSGKSHLMRVLQHLWINTEFPDHETARGVKALVPQLAIHLTELDTRAKQLGTTRWAAAGKFDAGLSGRRQ